MADQCLASKASTQKYYLHLQFIDQSTSTAMPDFRRTGKSRPTVCLQKNGRTRTVVSRSNNGHSGSRDGIYF